MAPSDEGGEPRIGMNVRAARRSRGMSLEALAGLTGRSKGWLSKIENGCARLERRQDIAAIAEALQVSADALVGEAAPEIRHHAAAPSFRSLRAALLDTTIDEPPDIPVRPVGVLAELTAAQDQALRRTDYATMSDQLPGLLGELQAHAATTGGSDWQLLASNNRRGALGMEKARAFAMLGKDLQAIAELRQAERLSPAQVRHNPLTRELVAEMLARARREAGGRDLRGLAWRMNLI